MRSIERHSSLFLLAPFFMVMGAFFILPLFLVVAYSLLKAGPYGGVIWDFSWNGYIQILFDRGFDGTYTFNTGYLIIFMRTIKLSLICMFLCLVVGFPTAYYMATRPPNQRNLWIVLITIPFWTNLLIRTYAWMLILRDEGIINSLLMKTGLISEPLPLLYNNFAIGVGLLYSYLPFMVLPIYSSLERMDWRLAEAAHDLYATRLKTLWHVVIPQAMPGILAGCVLVFIPAIGSFLAADLLGGGKQLMLGNLIQMQFGFSRNWPFGAAASVILMALVMIGLMILARATRGKNVSFM